MPISSDSSIHFVKSHPDYFLNILNGVCFHELRKNDRDYKVGDAMVLMEWNPIDEEYSGRELLVDITDKTDLHNVCAVSTVALHPDYCILSIKIRKI